MFIARKRPVGIIENRLSVRYMCRHLGLYARDSSRRRTLGRIIDLSADSFRVRGYDRPEVGERLQLEVIGDSCSRVLSPEGGALHVNAEVVRCERCGPTAVHDIVFRVGSGATDFQRLYSRVVNGADAEAAPAEPRE